ncbi:MAG TPA: hypothetical protein VE687_00670 [Stellaceae bacterium]|nr:hypothetical protein [Stellaceae bacterium]
MTFEAGAIIAPILLFGWPIVPACLIFETLGVIRVNHCVKPANNVANSLGGTGLRKEHPDHCEYCRIAEQPLAE